MMPASMPLILSSLRILTPQPECQAQRLLSTAPAESRRRRASLRGRHG